MSVLKCYISAYWDVIKICFGNSDVKFYSAKKQKAMLQSGNDESDSIIKMHF